MTDYQQLHPLQWAEKACTSLMEQYRPIQLPPENRWHYHQGVFLYGMYRVWEQTKKDEYFAYVKKYVDELVDEEGNFYFRRDELDAIQPGLLLFPIYEQTKDRKYEVAATKLRNLLKTLNKTTEGGYWHKDKYPYQMWLDGLYMAGPFSVIYGNAFNEPELIEGALYQEQLIRKNTKDETTGLYYHAWDELKQQPWADAVTGRAPEVWSRSIGWYGMALVDMLEHLPTNHPVRPELIATLNEFVQTIIRYQDEKTGLWYQILDKGNLADNWLESSGSCLFVYTIVKAINHNYIDQTYLPIAQKCFDGLVERMVSFDDEGRLQLEGICIGTSCGVYDYYVARETSTNDLHGLGAFILAAVELSKL
ncbi:MAG: glycoside hydrolase family 105 protein [Anaerobacillus sp.]|uniref:glycoside hydrolase family 88/105 protein n=1 Tax=Anaerobacillus sp. TaxID=1872506 RepID=UPI00391CCAB4